MWTAVPTLTVRAGLKGAGANPKRAVREKHREVPWERRRKIRLQPPLVWLLCQTTKWLQPIQPQKRVAVLKALAHPTRLYITETLMRGERCVGELRALVGDDVSTVSKHLLILRNAGVVTCQKRGLNVYYRLSCDCFSDFLQCVDRVCPLPAASPSRLDGCC